MGRVQEKEFKEINMQNGDCEQVVEWVSGSIFIRRVRLTKDGKPMDGHNHKFDHTTIIFIGAVRIKQRWYRDGQMFTKEEDFTAPAHAFIDKNIDHEITALSDRAEFWCVYSHRDAQGNVVLENKGWKPGDSVEAYT